MPEAITARGLEKTYPKGVRAVDSVDLEVPEGTVLGLLGPNGAGKTTVVRILTTLTRPDAGRATVLGRDVVREADGVRGLIGVTGQHAAVDELLSGRENLRMIGRLLGLRRREATRRSDELLGAFGLEDAAGRPVKGYSGGMQRRLDLAASLVGRPRVLFLDEPTTGLDPRSRLQLWDLIRGLVAQGTTVLLTTQYLEEADQLADRVAVIDHGQVIAAGTPLELKARVGGQVVDIRPAEADRLPVAAGAVAKALGVDASVRANGSHVTAPVSHPGRFGALVRRLEEEGVELAHLALRQPSLDEVFLTLTGRPAETPGSADDTTEGRTA